MTGIHKDRFTGGFLAFVCLFYLLSLNFLIQQAVLRLEPSSYMLLYMKNRPRLMIPHFQGPLVSNSGNSRTPHMPASLSFPSTCNAFSKIIFGGGLGVFDFDIGLSVQENAKEKKKNKS